MQFQQIATLAEASEEFSMSMMEPEKKLQSARQIQSDMPLLDRYTSEVQTVSKDVSTKNFYPSDFKSFMVTGPIKNCERLNRSNQQTQ